MKKLVEMVKIFILSIVLAVMMIPMMTCEASSITYLKGIVGNWYNINGNVALTISSDYKLNGCQIMNLNLGGDALVGTYEITYKDGNQNKFIEFWELSSIYEEPDYQFLIMNPRNKNEYILRKTKNQRHFESVGGIYIGMSESELLRLYGAPSSKEHYDRFWKDWIWKYNNLGLEVSVYGGIVTEITFFSYGDRKFDRSGLSAKNSESEFARKYNAKILRSNRGNGTAIMIGHGEAITIRNNYATLLIHQENTFAVW